MRGESECVGGGKGAVFEGEEVRLGGEGEERVEVGGSRGVEGRATNEGGGGGGGDGLYER